MQRIQDIRLKIKNLTEDLISEWGVVTVVMLLGLGSFGLGRLSALEDAKPIVSIRRAAAEEKAASLIIGGLVVASRRGSAYHYPWCAGADAIAEQNKVWFASEAKAKAAGYRPAKNCKGLEK